MQVALPRLSIDSDLSTAMASLTANDFITPCGSPVASTMSTLVPQGSPMSLGRRRLDSFDIVCLIGKGGFGKVFLVRHKATSAIYAMKVMEKDVLVQRKAVKDAHTERNILAMVGQSDVPFIVRLHVAFQTSRRVYLVMDFAAGGELMFHLRREAMLSEVEARFYAAELLIALESLHNMDIVHRDIKPENVLLDEDGHLVLTDFGLAKELTGFADQAHSWCGSEDYMAPEIVARKTHTGKPADYWAYGVFIYDCLCGQPPFSPLHEKGKLTRKRLHDRILKCKYRLPPYLSPECHSLLKKLLTKNPLKRLSDPDEIRKHPWFKGVDWDMVRAKQMTPSIVPSKTSPTACFSPSLTKENCSAPMSPVHRSTHREPPSAPVNIEGKPEVAADMWKGFSFVAPGMEVHFELAQPRPELKIEVPCLGLEESDAEDGSFSLGSNAIDNGFDLDAAVASCVGEEFVDGFRDLDDDVLEAEVQEFVRDAAEAVELDDEKVFMP